MADVYGALATTAFNTTPAEKTPVNSWGGKVRVMMDTYEADTAAAGTDVIVGRLPKGAIILNGASIVHDAMGASTTLSLVTRSVSDGATEVVVSIAEDSSSAGTIVADESEIALMPMTTTEEVDLIVKIAGGEATGTIKTEVKYVHD